MPSDTIELDGGTRAQPAPQQQQQVQQPAAPAVVVETTPTGPSDAEALASAQAALAQANQAREAAQVAARNAQSEAAQLRDQQARAAQQGMVSRKAMLAQAVESADADLTAARQALQTAGDGGDWAAVAAAQEKIASATYRKSQAAGELASIDAHAAQSQPQHQPQGQQPAASGYTPDARARQWMDEHPRFDSDPGYKATALALHEEASRAYGAGTEAYYSHLNGGLARVYGEGHGQLPGGQPMAGQGSGATSTAAPSNRGGAGSQGGAFKSVQTGLGPVNVQRTQGGGMRISFPDASVRENMEEGAKVCFPGEWAKDPAKALATYVGEQVRIAEEQAGGGTGGHVQGDGRIWR